MGSAALAAAAAEALHTVLNQKTESEYAGPCPKCGGEDRFVVFTDGKPRYWCRQCGYRGFLDGILEMTDEDRAAYQAASEEQRAAEAAARVKAEAKMAESKDHLQYYSALLARPEHIAYWTGEGITMDSIHRFQLGWCAHCPTDSEGRSSYTIPMWREGKLVNIRHRLETTASGDRYRPHAKHLPRKLLFNHDEAFGASTGIILEGAKKAIVLGQLGYATVAICGKSNYDERTLAPIRHWDPAYVMLDPDATDTALDIARMLHGRGYLVKTIVKPDDLIVQGHGSAADVALLLKYARRITP